MSLRVAAAQTKMLDQKRIAGTVYPILAQANYLYRPGFETAKIWPLPVPSKRSVHQIKGLIATAGGVIRLEDEGLLYGPRDEGRRFTRYEDITHFGTGWRGFSLGTRIL